MICTLPASVTTAISSVPKGLKVMSTAKDDEAQSAAHGISATSSTGGGDRLGFLELLVEHSKMDMDVRVRTRICSIFDSGPNGSEQRQPQGKWGWRSAHFEAVIRSAESQLGI